MKKYFISYLVIFVALLMIMSVSHSATEKIRGSLVAVLAPFWEKLIYFKEKLSGSSTERQLKEELEKIQVENQLLSQALAQAGYLLYEKQNLESQLNEITTHSSSSVEEDLKLYSSYLERLHKQVNLKMQALPAKVIYRSCDSWNCSLWINVGESDNSLYKDKIVTKDSPVLVGNSIVGVIDYVGKHQSRVRLITDPGLTPSVRAARGGEQEALMSEYIDYLLFATRTKKNLLPPEEQDQLMPLLETLKETLQPLKKTRYLAKGELRGSRHPTRRGYHQLLKGTGFNYDFADEEGAARDLRTGKLLHNPLSAPLPLIRVNDLLVTTGMDGIFPSGLKVAFVTKIDLLKEGDYFYEIEAKPTAGNLHDLSLVFVIPPVGYDKNDHNP